MFAGGIMQAVTEMSNQAGIGWLVAPFALLLLCIALGPLAFAHFWHKRYPLIAVGLGVISAACQLATGGGFAPLLHALEEYGGFIALIASLYIVSGGIHIRVKGEATPGVNCVFLLVGAVLANFIGTTGASMLLIRPWIRMNKYRITAFHIVFFIFIVSNVGGCLTPIGDPPLFLGFLQGIDFFWTAKYLWRETLMMWVLLLAIFFAVDSYFYHTGKEELPNITDATPDDAGPLRFEGNVNFILLAGILGLVLMSGLWKPGIVFNVMGTEVLLQNVVRDIGLVCIALLSLWLTPGSARAGNEFNWEPILEVAKLFAGIFITIGPVIAMLKAGVDGPFAMIVRLVNDSAGQPKNAMYFWATGLLSSFLDNAPTYLVFFNTAGGDAKMLMTEGASTLAAISAAAVFMGANTYIGNAPNLMVKAIAESRGLQMPSFFGYMLWSVGILVPIFVLMTFVFFR